MAIYIFESTANLTQYLFHILYLQSNWAKLNLSASWWACYGGKLPYVHILIKVLWFFVHTEEILLDFKILLLMEKVTLQVTRIKKHYFDFCFCRCLTRVSPHDQLCRLILEFKKLIKTLKAFHFHFLCCFLIYFLASCLCDEFRLSLPIHLS